MLIGLDYEVVGISEIVLIAAKCNVNTSPACTIGSPWIVLIAAKCNVNCEWW